MCYISQSHIVLYRSYQLKTSLVLFLKVLLSFQRPEDAPVTGNFLLDRLTGANVYLESEYDGDRFIALNRMMSSVKEKLMCVQFLHWQNLNYFIFVLLFISCYSINYQSRIVLCFQTAGEEPICY